MQVLGDAESNRNHNIPVTKSVVIIVFATDIATIIKVGVHTEGLFTQAMASREYLRGPIHRLPIISGDVMKICCGTQLSPHKTSLQHPVNG